MLRWSVNFLDVKVICLLNKWKRQQQRQWGLQKCIFYIYKSSFGSLLEKASLEAKDQCICCRTVSEKKSKSVQLYFFLIYCYNSYISISVKLQNAWNTYSCHFENRWGWGENFHLPKIEIYWIILEGAWSIIWWNRPSKYYPHKLGIGSWY